MPYFQGTSNFPSLVSAPSVVWQVPACRIDARVSPSVRRALNRYGAAEDKNPVYNRSLPSTSLVAGIIPVYEIAFESTYEATSYPATIIAQHLVFW